MDSRHALSATEAYKTENETDDHPILRAMPFAVKGEE